MNTEKLKGRDYVVLVDRSGSMAMEYKNGKSRFKYCEEQATAVAHIANGFDPDGITLGVFNNKLVLQRNVTPGKIAQIFSENSPAQGTDTAGALKQVFDEYFAAKAAGTAKPTTIIVFTDGEPSDRTATRKVIVEAANKIDADEELAVTFLQVGDDAGAASFLKELDDNLVPVDKAKFDIVDCKTDDEQGNMSIEELLLAAIED